jgi:hypothetical protein
MSDLLSRLEKLEAERFTVYRRPAAITRTIRNPTQREAQAEIDKARAREETRRARMLWIYFDAGRYEAGARDDEAIAAHEEFAKLEQKATAKALKLKAKLGAK